LSRLPAYALALALSPLPVFAQEDDGTFLEGLLERNLSGAGRDVQISGFRGALSSTATFDRLTIADDVGIWLTLEDVTLEWSRSALLRGALVVDRLTAGSIDLPRLPQGGEEQEQLPSPEAPGFSLPELPVSVQIGIIASPSISIGEPVFGVASDFSLEAGLSLIGGEGAGRLDITRIDGPEGRFQVDAAYSNATEVLTAALTLAEAPGGIFSTLAGLPGEPSVDLIVNGQGPLSDFEATLALATDGEERLGGTLVIGSQDAQPGAPSPFRADVAGNIAPLLAPAYRDFVGDEVSLLVAGQRAPDGALDLETFTLDAGQLRLDGQLSRGADGMLRSFDVEGEIASDDASPVLLPLPGEPTRVDRVTLDAAFDAAEGETWQGAFRIFGFDRPGFSAETLTLDGDGSISATGGGYTANFDFAAEALDLGDPAAEAALGERVTGRIELSGAPDALVEIGRFDIAGETYVLESSGTLDVADRDLGVEGRARIRAQDLTVFSGIAGRPLSGSAELTVTGAGTLLGRAFDVVVDGQTVDLSIGLPEADRVVAGTTRLSLSARRDEEGLALRAFRLGSPVARVTAEGTLRSAGTVLNLSASIDDGSLVLPGLDGRHSLSLMAQGTGEVWNIRSSLTGATLGGSVEGQLDDEREVPVFDGVVTLDARSLAPLAAPAGLPALSGGLSLRLDGSVFGDLSRFDVRITGFGSDVTTGIDVVDPLLAGAVSLSVDAARVTGPIVIRDLSAQTETLSLEGAGTLDGLPPALLPPPSGIAAQDMVPSFEGRLALRADNLAPASRLSGIPGLAGAFAITLEGTAVADLSEFDLVLDAEASGLTLGRADLDTFLSDGPLSLTISAEREAAGPVALRTLSLATGSMSVGAGGVLTGLPEALAELDATTFADAAFEGELSVAAQSVAPLGPLLGRPGLSGALDATLTGSLAGDLSQFDIRLVAREEALTLGLPRFDPLLRGGLAVTVDAARAPDGPVELRAFDLESPAVTLRAEGAITELPRSLTALEPNALETAAFDGSARIDADNLAPLGPLVGLPGLGGAVQATVEGSVAADFEDLDVRLDANGVNLRTGIAALDTYLGGGTVLALDVVRADGRFDIRRARFASPGLTAEVEGQLGPEDGDLAARVTLDDLGRIIDGISGRATADLTARRSGGAPWRIDSTVDGPGGTAVRAEGTVATAFDRVDLTLRGAAPLAFANPFIAPRALGGQARFDLRVSGPPALSSCRAASPLTARVWSRRPSTSSSIP
jgi:translocation and assembly module TamB